MLLSDVFNIRSIEGYYLRYIINEYDKRILSVYDSLYMKRESKLDVLLDKKFAKSKESVDIEIELFSKKLDNLDINNLNREELEKIAEDLDNLSKYLKYIISEIEKENLPF